MLQDVIHPPEQQLDPLENISSPISAQMFEFSDHDLFPENLPNSDVSSSNNCCYEENSSYAANLSYASYALDGTGMYSNNNFSISNNCNPNDILNTMITNNNLPMIFDSQDENENNITSSMNLLSSSPNMQYPIPPMITTQEEEFDFSSLQVPPLPLTDDTNGFSPYSVNPICSLAGSGPPLPSIFEDDCLSSLPTSYASLDPCSPSCSCIDPSVGSFLPGNFTSTTPLSTDCGSGIFSGGMLMGSELQQELDLQGDNSNGVYVTDTMQRVFNPTDIQALNHDNQLLVNECSNNNTTQLTSELASLDESSYKVGRLSVEERKEKIHRYMKKRNERNFSKKIKYACRKTLADSRPRVRGRFAKNDDFGDSVRNSCSNLEDDEAVGKEEDVDSSDDIFAHISGVNSFKCNYDLLQSWI